MPVPGGVAVTPVARAEFLRMLLEREIRGIEVYGQSLTTHNGRNAIRDLLEELIDGWQYAVQVSLEWESLISENARLRAELAALREANDA